MMIEVIALLFHRFFSLCLGLIHLIHFSQCESGAISCLLILVEVSVQCILNTPLGIFNESSIWFCEKYDILPTVLVFD